MRIFPSLLRMTRAVERVKTAFFTLIVCVEAPLCIVLALYLFPSEHKSDEAFFAGFSVIVIVLSCVAYCEFLKNAENFDNDADMAREEARVREQQERECEADRQRARLAEAERRRLQDRAESSPRGGSGDAPPPSTEAWGEWATNVMNARRLALEVRPQGIVDRDEDEDVPPQPPPAPTIKARKPRKPRKVQREAPPPPYAECRPPEPECFICLDRPPSAAFVHADCLVSHGGVCFECANISWAGDHRCGACGTPACGVIRLYDASFV